MERQWKEKKKDNYYDFGHAWNPRMHSGIKWDLLRRALFRKTALDTFLIFHPDFSSSVCRSSICRQKGDWKWRNWKLFVDMYCIYFLNVSYGKVLLMRCMFLCDKVGVFMKCVCGFSLYSQTVTLNFSARPKRRLKIEKSIRAFLKQNQFVVRFLHTWLASISPHKRCESAAFYGAFVREVPHTALPQRGRSFTRWGELKVQFTEKWNLSSFTHPKTCMHFYSAEDKIWVVSHTVNVSRVQTEEWKSYRLGMTWGDIAKRFLKPVHVVVWFTFCRFCSRKLITRTGTFLEIFVRFYCLQ